MTLYRYCKLYLEWYKKGNVSWLKYTGLTEEKDLYLQKKINLLFKGKYLTSVCCKKYINLIDYIRSKLNELL